MKWDEACRHGFMALEPEVVKRRVRSAREFAGLEQKEIGRLMKADGFGIHDVGKWERMDPTAPPMSPGRAQSLSHHTGLPVAWFTEPDLSAILSEPREGDRVADLEARLEETNAALRDLAARQLDADEEAEWRRYLATGSHSATRERGGASE
jgi:transcriptional regulator with XRE-family HTH domain